MRSASVLVVGLMIVLAVGAAGCSQAGIEANKRQLDQQKAELEKLKQEIAALKAAPPPSYPSYPTAMPPPGSCNTAVMQAATRRGGENFAAGNFSLALGYYKDAVTACPTSAQAELNVARAYEALGLRDEAIAHYKLASESTAPDGSQAATQARQALVRLGARQ